MSGIYGNINNVDTTGASDTTATADHLSVRGVAASDEMAKHDMVRMEKYRSKIENVAEQKGIDPSVIAGIISRETRAGGYLNSNGYGKDGFGYGIMQVDTQNHKLVEGGPDSLEHIKQGTQILVDMMKSVKRKFPNWNADKVLKGGIRAYNRGVDGIHSYNDMDVGTAGGDYANDVVARAQYYKRNGY